MATIHECDRCGSTSKDKEELANFAYPVWQNYMAKKQNDWPTKNVDICSKCIKELTDFMKPIPKMQETIGGISRRAL